MTQKDDAERAAFEAWFSKSGFWNNATTWAAWQARAALDASAEPVAYIWRAASPWSVDFDAPAGAKEVIPIFTRPDANKRDAERYRWLREHSYIELLCDSPRVEGYESKSLDAAIDAALSQANKGNGND